MNQLKEHILMKFAIIVLIAVLLTPSVVKLSHAFANHTHEICTSDVAEHVHKIDLECEFYKFKISKEHTHILNSNITCIIYNEISPIISQYNFISDYQKLSFDLRGPPNLV